MHDAWIRLVNVVRLHGTIVDQIVSTRHATGVGGRAYYNAAESWPFAGGVFQSGTTPLLQFGAGSNTRFAGTTPWCGLPQATAGVNWSPTDNLRVMLNYTHAAPDEVSTGVSSANFVGMRPGLSWQGRAVELSRSRSVCTNKSCLASTDGRVRKTP